MADKIQAPQILQSNKGVVQAPSLLIKTELPPPVTNSPVTTAKITTSIPQLLIPTQEEQVAAEIELPTQIISNEVATQLLDEFGDRVFSIPEGAFEDVDSPTVPRSIEESGFSIPDTAFIETKSLKPLGAQLNTQSAQNTEISESFLKGASSFIMGTIAARSIAASALDTLLSSLLPDSILEPGDFLKFALPEDDPSRAFFEQNKFATQFVGDVGLSIVTGSAGVQVAKVAGLKLFSTFQQIKGGEVLSKLLFVAPTGRVAEVGRRVIISKRLDGMAGLGLGLDISNRAARIARNFRTLKITDAAKIGLQFELAVFGAGNSSEILFPSSLDDSTLLAFSLLGVAIPSGVATLSANLFISRAGRAAASLANRTVDPANIVKNATASDDVGLSIMADALSIESATTVLRDPASFAIDVALATDKANSIKTVILATQKSLKNNLEEVAAANLPGLQLNLKINPSEKQVLVQQAMETLASDPTSLSGVKSIVPTKFAQEAKEVVEQSIETLKTQVTNLDKKLSRSLDDDDVFAIAAEMDKLQNKQRVLEQTRFTVLSAEGEATSLETFGGHIMFGDDAAGVVFSKSKSGFTGVTKIVTFPEKNRGGLPVTISIDEQLNFVGAELKDLSPRGTSILFAHMKEVAKTYKVKNSVQIVLNEKSSFLKFRLAEEVLKVNPSAASDIRITGDMGLFSSLEEGLQFGRIQKQFETYISLLDEAKNTRGVVSGERNAAGVSEQMVAFKVDLPGGHVSTNLQGPPGRHPLFGEGQSSLEQFFLSLAIQGETKIPASFKQGGLDSIKAFMQGRGRQLSSNVTSFKSFVQGVENVDMPLNGSSLTNADKPTFVSIGDNVLAGTTSREHIIEQVAMREALTFKALSESSHPFVQQMAKTITRQDFSIARDLNTLSEASTSGPAVFVTGRFSTRNDPLFQAVNNINTSVQRFTAKYIENIFKVEFEGATGLISNRVAIGKTLGDKSSLVEFGTFFSAHENSFFKAERAILGEDGRWRYPLISEAENAEQFATNQARYLEVFGVEMPSNANLAYLRDGLPVEVALRGQAHDTVMALSDITRDVGLVKSEFNQIINGREIPLRNIHLPARDLSNDSLAFIVDITGKVRNTISEASLRVLERTLKGERVTEILKNNQGFTIIRSTDVERFTELSDNIFLGAVDAGSLLGAKQAVGGISSGKLAEQGKTAIENIISNLERQYNAASLRSLSLLFEKELNRVKVLDDAFKARDSKKTFTRKAIDDTVFATYRKQLLGEGTINSNGFLRDINGAGESVFDSIFASLRDRMGGRNFVDLLKKTTGLDKREAQIVIDTLGSYSPYSSTTRFIEEQLGHRVPVSLKKNQAQLSGITTTLLLRFGEIAQASINILGTAVNLPAIMNGLKRLPGETDLIYRERTAPFGPMLGAEDGKGFTTLSPLTSLIDGVMFTRTPEGRAVVAKGRRLGSFDQQAAETVRSLSITGGNPVANILQNGMKIATYLSDKSEEMSRLYAHIIGYRAGMAAGITDKAALHTLGDGVANAAIGDYRTVNRPGVFRGPVLSAFGLFQTFAQQMGQRIFGYIENKQVRSLAIQEFMQASFFGGKSIPGASQINELIAMASDQQESITTLTDKITGSALGTDLLLNGFVGSIPRVFGANDSFAISGRGAADFRGFGGMNVLKGETPQFSVLKQIAGGGNAFVDQFREGGQFSVQRTAEIFTTFSPNRFLARTGELATGVAVDKRGGLISSDMLNATTIAAGLLSLRTSRVQDELEARFRNNLLSSHDREIKSRLKDSLSSIIRSGKLDADVIFKALISYTKSHGQPENFVPLVNNIIIRATTPKSFLEIKKFLVSKQFNQMSRMINALQ